VPPTSKACCSIEIVYVSNHTPFPNPLQPLQEVLTDDGDYFISIVVSDPQKIGDGMGSYFTRLPDQLPNLALLYEVPDPTWGHLDFIFATEVKKVINDMVVDYTKAYDAEDSERE